MSLRRTYPDRCAEHLHEAARQPHDTEVPMSNDTHEQDKAGDKGGGPSNGPKPVTIYVNTRPHEVAKDDISFEEVVAFAYPTPPPGTQIGYTVLYQRGQGNKGGTLVAGQSVKAKERDDL